MLLGRISGNHLQPHLSHDREVAITAPPTGVMLDEDLSVGGGRGQSSHNKGDMIRLYGEALSILYTFS